MKKSLVLSIILVGVFFSCKKDIETINGQGAMLLPAGVCSVNDETSLAFSYRINGLTSEQNLSFFVGNSFFQQNWVEAPSSTTARDGLGPLFNTASCSSCHFKDGRGKPLTGEGILLRLSIPGGVPEPTYGSQFQDHAISTALPEGNIAISYTEIGGQYADGTPYSLRQPHYSLSNFNYGSIDPSVVVSPRVGPQMIGLGLLELISESDILMNEDISDADGDGISGRANFVYDEFAQTTVLGRFGWKANTGTMETQVAAAFNGDIGIKTSLFPSENHTIAQGVLNGLPDGGTIEIENDDFDDIVLYCRTLAVPKFRNTQSGVFQSGHQLFNSIGCNKCHKQSFITGSGGELSALNGVQINPFTDLLLHDMGDGLADHRPDGLANGNEWRTPPLWGIGLIQTVNGHTNLLHDGRARSIEEAILWHGGEAEDQKNKYLELPFSDRQRLITFLQSL